MFFGLAESRADTAACDIALVLADDVSGSMDEEEFRFVVTGYEQAFTDPRVIEVITGGAYGCIWVTALQWSQEDLVTQVLPWTRIGSAVESQLFARSLGAMQRKHKEFAGTCAGCGISFGITLFDSLPGTATRHVIDMTGDGDVGDPAAAKIMRDRAVAKRISINGLIIGVNEVPYESSVIGGAGNFLLKTKDYSGFPESIAKKLVLEIAGRTPQSLRFASK